MSGPMGTPGALEPRDLAPLERRLAWHAARLFAGALLSGALVGGAAMGLYGADERMLLGGHIVGVTGCLWLCAIGWSLPRARITPANARLLVTLAALASWGNWVVTTGKAFFRVRGVAVTEDAVNNAVFGILTGIVVLPTFVAVWRWMRAFPAEGEGERGGDAGA